MKTLLVAILLLVSITSISVAANDKSPLLELRIQEASGALDIFIVNISKDDVSIYPRINYGGLDRNVELYFYAVSKKCESCGYHLREPVGTTVPPAISSIILLPGEISGRRFAAKAIAATHNLKPGCYGVYAKYNGPPLDPVAFSGTLISNAVKMCVLTK